MGGFNHSKLLVSDDNLCTVGSTNVDFRSFENNFEANAFFYDEEMAQRIKAIYLKDESQSILVDDVSYFVKRPFMKRFCCCGRKLFCQIAYVHSFYNQSQRLSFKHSK